MKVPPFWSVMQLETKKGGFHISASLKEDGLSSRLKPCSSGCSHAEQAASSKVRFMLLHLHHEMVEVDELRADGQAAERRLVEDLVEAVVVLDELSQSALQGHEKRGEVVKVCKLAEQLLFPLTETSLIFFFSLTLSEASSS